jgi:putative iron-dependent peroxidase
MSTIAHPQAGILLPPPPASRHLEFALRPGVTRATVVGVMRNLSDRHLLLDGTAGVVGLGPSLVELLGLRVPGLRTFPPLENNGIHVPSTPHALWIWARGEDRGELLNRSRVIAAGLGPAFALEHSVDTFVYDGGRDLTGYEDGTENPKADDATIAAIVADPVLAPTGSSFVAVQRWLHDLDHFESLTIDEQHATMGRERVSNVEIDDAPASAHVKRTAQESFDPPAFVVRRSMPWAEGNRAGLVFVAFGSTLDKYERQLRRMVGLEDGVADGLFSFTRPLSGAYYWCPPLVDGQLAITGLE